jgi:hypothetical protein
MGIDHYKHLGDNWVGIIAYTTIDLAVAMAADFRSKWNENYMPLDEATMAMMPFALQIMIESSKPTGEN